MSPGCKISRAQSPLHSLKLTHYVSVATWCGMGSRGNAPSVSNPSHISTRLPTAYRPALLVLRPILSHCLHAHNSVNGCQCKGVLASSTDRHTRNKTKHNLPLHVDFLVCVHISALAHFPAKHHYCCHSEAAAVGVDCWPCCSPWLTSGLVSSTPPPILAPLALLKAFVTPSPRLY